MRAGRWWRFGPPALFLLGALLACYPYAAQWFEQRSQSRVIETLSTTTEQVAPDERAVLLARAEKYNEVLATGVGELGQYAQQLDVGVDGAMARLRIPAINLDQPIRHGMSEDVLRSGLGHLEGTSLPVGGWGTNAVIGGHRGLAEAVGFTHLPDLKVGDWVYVDVLGQVLAYQVTSTEVLDPGTAEVQPIVEGQDTLTLVTCTPLGRNTDRFVAKASRVLPTPPGLSAGTASSAWFPWWTLGVGAGVVVAVAWAGLTRRRPDDGSRTPEALDADPASAWSVPQAQYSPHSEDQER